MKAPYIFLIGPVLISAYFIFFKKQEVVVDNTVAYTNAQDTVKPKVTNLQQNTYEDLKRLAYSVQYQQLHLPDNGDKEVLYGVLMDWDYEGKAIITLVSFKTGDVSLYFSTGSGVIGAGQHPEVQNASKAFIDKAKALLPQATNKDTALTTETGHLKFYLMTNKGRYVVKDKMENVNNFTSPLSPMFEEANKLIAYMRMVEEKSKH